ncbi:hypothetical protein TNCV_1010001 [Trichonephila clavipes]|nr:hypothetical protein TNCV_1010001 [Trichonephila clavipes]
MASSRTSRSYMNAGRSVSLPKATTLKVDGRCSKLFRVAFSQRSSSPRLIEDETFNDSDIINNLINYEDGQVARFLESG